VKAQVVDCLKDLGVQSLHCVLIHDWEEIDLAQRVRTSRALARLKNEGLIANVGVSIYEERGLQAAATLFEELDVAQVPANALDRRLDMSPVVAGLHETGTVFQVRSVLLQGLLADQTNQAKSQHPAIKKFQAESQGEPVACALSHVKALPWADEIVVGVSTAEELREITSTWNRTAAELQSPEIGTDDIDLIDPRRWTQKIEG
jgi:aryl-alcohol dehydrogenase-like predicted oxidoreductase